MQTDPEIRKLMSRAIKLAEKGIGWVNPNPMVGAVVVKDGKIIGEGYHEYYGAPHAEVNAIRMAGDQAPGATLFVTLEPCSHQGKTPPCAPMIAEKGISEVIIGMKDPNPVVNGKGIAYLQSKGIKVRSGILEDEIRKQNETFISYITTHRPFCILKTAMSLDGKIATGSGQSKWITGEQSRTKVHELRHHCGAILTGIGTILADDPTLNARRKNRQSKDPLKVILDTKAKIPLSARVIQHEPQLTILAVSALADKNKLKAMERLGVHILVCPAKEGKIDLDFVIASLGSMDIDSVLIEGGSTLAFSALDAGIVDKYIGFVAPIIIGGESAPGAVGGSGISELGRAFGIKNLTVKKCGKDLMLTGYLNGRHEGMKNEK